MNYEKKLYELNNKIEKTQNDFDNYRNRKDLEIVENNYQNELELETDYKEYLNKKANEFKIKHPILYELIPLIIIIIGIAKEILNKG